MVSILELLSSTYKLDNYTDKSLNTRHPAYVFSKKTFGAVYAYNKTVLYKSNFNIVELDMIIGVSTEKNKTAHRVSIALNGIDSQEYSTQDLVHLIKATDARLTEVEDAEIINNVLKGVPFLLGKVIMQKDTNKNKFIVFSNKIPLKSQIKVKCTCSDYYYTFAWYNFDKKCHIGNKPPKYVKYTGLEPKESKSLVPVRNPRKLPGVCKHLLLFLALLMSEGIVTESTPLTSNFSKSFPKSNIMNRQDITNLNNQLKKEIENSNKERRAERTRVNRIDAQARQNRKRNKED